MNNFSYLADKVLDKIVETIESKDINCEIDIDNHGDLIELNTENGIFVINKHSAAMEIWLASPISGPHHFGYKNNSWQSSNGLELFEVLTKDLKIIFSQEI